MAESSAAQNKRGWKIMNMNDLVKFSLLTTISRKMFFVGKVIRDSRTVFFDYKNRLKKKNAWWKGKE